MESYEVLQEAIAAVGAKEVAATLGLSTSIVYKWGEPPQEDEDERQSGARNPLDRLLSIYKATGQRSIIDWMCGQAGGFFVTNPERLTGDVDSDAVTNMQQLMSEFTDVLAEVSGALEDGEGIDEKEARHIRKEWEELKSLGEAFVAACEKGVFEK